MIDDNDTIIEFPANQLTDQRGRLHPRAKQDNRVRVTIRDTRWEQPLQLYFESLGDDAALIGVEFGSPDSWTKLDPKHVSRVADNIGLYEAYARAEIEFRHGDAVKALATLNDLGTTRRGKPARFLRSIAREYETRVNAGEAAPITAIARDHQVAKSTASRWVSQAKRFGWIKED